MRAMKCEQIQPNLLDYGKGRLSSSEHNEIKLHIEECPECRALLEEELAFNLQLSTVPIEEPVNDVWALVRTKTRSRRYNPFGWLRTAFSTHYRRAAATAVALGAIAAVVFSNLPVEDGPKYTAKIKPPAESIAVVKWSDDPLGKHTDAMVDLIDRM